MIASVRSGLDALQRRVASGEVGSLPVILGLVLIWAVFTYLNPLFLSPLNLTNLLAQIAATGIVSVGIVMVLLLGEIDLSVGSVYGLGSAVMAVLAVQKGWPAAPAIAAGVLTGTLIGTFHGFFFTRFRIPSFVVTLAGLLTWFGAQLHVLGEKGTINLNDPIMLQLANQFYPASVGWTLALICVALLGTDLFFITRRRRAAAGLPWATWPGALSTVSLISVLFLSTL